MTRLPLDPESFEAERSPHFAAMAERLRLEADELAEQYSPSEMNSGLSSALSVAQDRSVSESRSLPWRPAIAVSLASSLLIIASWGIVQKVTRDSEPQPLDLAASHSPEDDSPNVIDPARQSDLLETLPVITEPSMGLHDMNGPELEAVLNFLDDDAAPLKLAI